MTSGSRISSKSFNAKQTTTQADVNNGTKPFTDLQDGSLGKLLWAVLYNMGQWEDANIYVEELPSGSNGIAAEEGGHFRMIPFAEPENATTVMGLVESNSAAKE